MRKIIYIKIIQKYDIMLFDSKFHNLMYPYKKDHINKQKINQYLLIFKLINQLAYTFIYYLLTLLTELNVFRGATFNMRTFLQLWSIFYSFVFVFTGIISINLLNIYTSKSIDKAKKVADVTFSTLDSLYFVCELLILIEMFKNLNFGKPINKAKFSIYEATCIMIFALASLISIIYVINSAINLHQSNKLKNNNNIKNMSEKIALACDILLIVCMLLTVISYITSNLENRRIINAEADVKLISVGILIASALIGSISIILSVYDEFRTKASVYGALQKDEEPLLKSECEKNSLENYHYTDLVNSFSYNDLVRISS